MKRLQIKLRHRLKRILAAALPWSDLAKHHRTVRACGSRIHALDADAMLDDAEHAMHHGQSVRAQLALAAAQRVAPDNGRTIEIEARLALLRARPREAVDRLERDASPNDRRRLLLALARCQAGDIATAHLDLAAWSRRDDCPPEARILLAKLELDADDVEAARTALRGHRHRPNDPMTCQMLILIDTAEDLPQAAQQAAAMLARAIADRGGSTAMNNRWLATLGLTPRTVRVEPTHEQVAQLAQSLSHEPTVIPSLVRAQQIEAKPTHLRLLRRALVRIADTLPEPRIAFEALANLAEIDSDRDDAARWARRVLRDDAYSAPMALLLDRVGHDKTSHTTDALEHASAQHPEFSDVQRALIDRYRRVGRLEDARAAADRWIARDPSNPTAAAVAKELAA